LKTLETKTAEAVIREDTTALQAGILAEQASFSESKRKSWLDNFEPGSHHARDSLALSFRRCRMKRFLYLGLTVAFLLAGCEPQQSLSPLVAKEDTLFDKQLLGEWQIWGGTSSKPEDKPGLIVFRAADAAYTYDVKVSNFDEEGGTLSSVARLVKLGDYVFIDFGTPDTDKWPQTPYPALSCHVFGRLTLEKDRARMNFLSDDWVRSSVKTAKLPLVFDETSSPVLSATTADLRQFALAHAEDHEAFSETFTLVRKN
jgi:hypothetical protein